MKNNSLTPGVTTHFRSKLEDFYWKLTPGKNYKILGWEDNRYYFLDDTGERRRRWSQYGVVDASYEINLEKILE